MFLKLTALFIVLLGVSTQTAFATNNRYNDPKAGISYPVLSSESRTKSPKEIMSLNNAQAAKAARITYTSGYYLSKEKTPYMLVWTVPLESTLTRSAIDSLRDGELVFRLLGIKDWRFNAKILRGSGMGQRNGAIRSELVMQVLKNRYAYVGFFYEQDEQLNDWKKIKAGIEPLPSLKVDYKTLPQSVASSTFASIGKILLVLVLLAGCGFAGWIGFKQYHNSKPAQPTIKKTTRRAA